MKGQCLQCKSFEVVQDESLCYHAKCMATSKIGKSMYWAYTTCNFFGQDRVSGGDNCFSVMKRRGTPKWCPLLNG